MVVEGVEYLRVNILKLLVGAYLRFRLEGWVPMGWSALNPERLLLSSHLGDQVYLNPIIQFIHRVINKVAIETGFRCILIIKESDWGGEEGACFIFWPWP